MGDVKRPPRRVCLRYASLSASLRHDAASWAARLRSPLHNLLTISPSTFDFILPNFE
jgi:hypothetical protein